METGWKAGLEDVIAARSAICAIDGEAGRLYYRGYEIADLVEVASFEEVTYLLWFGELPTPAEQGVFEGQLREARQLPAPVLELLQRLPPSAHPLEALRTAVSLAASHDPDGAATDREANLRKSLRLVNLVPAVVAAWHRLRNGREPIAPRPDLSHAAHFLWLFSGVEPAPDVARLMDVILTLHAEHEFNASTFVCRVVVATMADLYAAVAAAVAALKGPRHGGANEDVLALLLEIGDPERAERVIEERLALRTGLSRTERADPKARIPGFGHRVYKVDDARARVLWKLAKSMAQATGHEALFEVAERVHATMKTHAALPVNVDFFSAVVYHALGIPPDFCTSMFATGRIAGWCAHALEQYADNRLIRPRAEYVGQPPRAIQPRVA